MDIYVENPYIGGYYVVIKETIAGQLNGLMTFELHTGIGNNVTITDATPAHVLRQPSIGECYSKRELGKKLYELSNHLDNVMEVITDRKIGIDAGTYDVNGTLVSTTPDGIIDHYAADIVSYSDYYPLRSIHTEFGMLLTNRHKASNEFLYIPATARKKPIIKPRLTNYATVRILSCV